MATYIPPSSLSAEIEEEINASELASVKKTMKMHQISKGLAVGVAAVLCCLAAVQYWNGSDGSVINMGARDRNHNNNKSRSRRLLSSDNRALAAHATITGVDSGSPEAPALLWLMSFPESGGSYVVNTLQTSSGFGTASNYGNIFMNAANDEYVVDTYRSVPVYSDRPNGPFLFSDRPIPPKFIVTKTHCGGHCIDCTDAKEFVLSTTDFYLQCATATAFYPHNKEKEEEGSERKVTQYDPRSVSRAIHLTRNPFDNIASRFHKEYRAHSSRNNFDFTANFPYNREGFHNWCAYNSKRIDPKMMANRHKSSHVPDADYFFATAQTQVPCYAEFYKYVQWHNHAASTLSKNNTDDHDPITSLTLHYEDFLHHYQPAVNALLKFSALPHQNPTKKLFFQRYDYFTDSERHQVKEFLRTLANDEAAQVLAPYLS